ncbi:MAG: hypothetical protein GY821_12905 [Gammaproteobacteria bacterium]|nr:hypothetical protein [Gammaproteobacteria bacterium]
MNAKEDKFIERMKRSSAQGEQKSSHSGQRKVPLDLKILSDDDIVWYKPKKTKGKERNRIDILPWNISKDWYSKLREYQGTPCGVGIGDMEYALIIPVHYDVGVEGEAVLCLSEAFGGQCAICDEMFDKIREDKVKHKELINGLRAKWRCFYNVYDHEDSDFVEIKLWEMSFHLFEKYLREESRDSDEGSIPFAHLSLGKTITFKGREESFGDRTYIEAVSIEFEDREEYHDDVVDSTYKLDTALIIPNSAEVKKSFYAISELTLKLADNEFDGAEEKEEPKKKEKPKRRIKKSKEDELLEIKENKCPSRLNFGVDANNKPECEDCEDDVFEECCDKQVELQSMENAGGWGGADKEVEKDTSIKPKGKKKSFNKKS